MQALLGLLTTLLPLAYFALVGAYVMVFTRDDTRATAWSRRLLIATMLLHLAAVAVRTIVLDRVPMGTPLEFFSLLALALIATYAFIESRQGVRQTGFVITGLAFLLQLIASSFVGTAHPPRSALLEEPGYVGHAVLVLLAYSALSIGFLYAVLYLIQARQLSRKTFGLLFRRLPPLDTLERMSVGSVQLGVPLLLASLVTGHVWLANLMSRVPHSGASDLSHGDPKIVASWLILFAYSAGLLGHRYLGWRGRRMNVLAICGYVLMVAGIALIHHFFPSFHNFSTHGGV